MEKIVCAAIWVRNGEKVEMGPNNIKEGFVLAGLRHIQIVTLHKHLLGDVPDDNKVVRGFLSTQNRFLNRIEAMEVAKIAGQINTDRSELMSDDLY